MTFDFFSSDIFSSDFCSSQLAQTDRQKATHKSPPCMGTGGLKKSRKLVLSVTMWHILKFIYNNRFYLEISVMTQVIGFVICEVLLSLFFSPCEDFDMKS